MDIINFKSLYKILNDKIDYIATATTPWHAYGVLAAIKKIEEENNCKLKGIILILRNLDEGYLLNEEYFKSLNCKVYYFDYKRTLIEHLLLLLYKIKYIITINNNSKRNFYVFSQLTPNINFLAYASQYVLDRKFASVICDEGIGSYFIENYRYKRRKFPYSSLFAKLYYTIEVNILLPISIKKLTDNNLVSDCCLLKNENNKYIDNNIGSYFNYAISCITSNYKFEINQSNFRQKYIIINTEPFKAIDIFDEQILHDLYSKVISLCSNYGYKVFIKPHPRENNLSKYDFTGVDVIDTKLSQEEFNLIVRNKPKAVISIMSTTLLTSPILFGIKSICIGRYLNNNSISRHLYESIEMANIKFNRFILFPTSDIDFLNIINSIK